MKYNKIEEKNYDLHEIKINKFKTIQIDLKFIEKVNKDTITKRSLLPYVLKAASNKYRSKMDIRLKLEDLYGANLYVNSSKTGALSVITFSFSFVNERYLKESLNEKIIDFINEIIFNPLIDESGFNKEIFDEEVRLLKDEFSAIIDNKSKYASRRLNEEMFKDESYKYSSLGLIEDLDNINEKSLYDYYKNEFLKNDLYIIVNGEDNNIKDLIKERINFKNIKMHLNPIDYETKKILNVNKVIEKQKINQAKLAIGYRCEIRINDDLRYPMIMASCILGGYPHSKLFRIVREKNSLAYSIYSRYDAYKGCLFINAGINNDCLDKALELIEYCLNELQTNISKEEFEMTRVSLINDYLEMLDSQSAMSTKAFNTAILGKDFDINETINKINNVKIEDVYEASKKIKLDTIYFLGCEINE